MKRVILVISSAFVLGYWSRVFAESFGCPRLYPSPNPLSATSFAKTYGGIGYDFSYSVQQTSDGGYIVAGATSSFGAGSGDIILIKTDANGNISWAKTYGRAGWDEARSVQQTSDGGYIVAGRTNSFGAGSYDIILIKTNANGNISWAKTYGGTDYEEASSVQQTSDGGYIVAGRTYSFGAGGYDIILIKMNANGNISWAKTYGGTDYEEASSVQQTSDGGYIVAGATSSFGAGGYDIILIKTDANGNISWAKTYGGTDWDFASSVQQTSDGGYIVAGYTYSFGAGSYDIILIKTDANGNISWAKTYGRAGWDEARSVQQTSDGGYIVAGYTYSFGAGSYDIILIKTDANGNISWAKTYGGTDWDEARSVQQISDGGYIVAGRTYSFSVGSDDIFLIKTDANGDIRSCSIVEDVSPTVITPSLTVDTPSPSVPSASPTVNSVSPTVRTPTPTVNAPCPISDDNELGISESCHCARGFITPYKGGIKVIGSGEFEVKVYNVSGGVVKSVKGKNEVKLELSRGVYFVEVVSSGRTIREKVVIR
ncbi:T9SS type A sorting domain-containing protein [Candidatus Caldipriscus sp.]|nr:T9SS type A sorting domain-containing protein [Candidatus Caldipriscus sp.]